LSGRSVSFRGGGPVRVGNQDNGAGDNLLISFYAKNRVIDGMEDGFMVKIVS
jgi:hypothetical protein